MQKFTVPLMTAVLVALFSLSAMPVAAQEVVHSLEEVAAIDVTAQDMEFAAPHLYLLTATGVRIYDLTDPQAPELVGSYAATGLVDIALHGERLYAIDADTLYAIDVSDPSQATLVADEPVGASVGVRGLAVSAPGGHPVAYALFDVGGGCGVRSYALPDLTFVDSALELDQPCATDDIEVQGNAVFFVSTQVPYYHLCCERVWRVEDSGAQGAPGELSEPTDLGNFRVLSLGLAPDGIGYAATTVSGDPCHPHKQAFVIRSFRTDELAPTFSETRHLAPNCGEQYGALRATADLLYIGGSALYVYRRVAPERETLLTTYDPAEGIGGVEAQGDVVLLRLADEVAVLRWVETVATPRAFIPQIQGIFVRK